MVSNRAHKVASILNEDGLTSLLDGADAQATRPFFEDYLCDDLDIIGCYFTRVFNILYYTYHKTESIDSDADIQYEELQQLKQLQLVLKYAVLLSLFLYNYKQTMDHKIKF